MYFLFFIFIILTSKSFRVLAQMLKNKGDDLVDARSSHSHFYTPMGRELF